MVDKIEKTDAEWRVELTDEQYRVARQAGTEAPFSGKYNAHAEIGTYRCLCCGLALFESDTKFDAGCGWPSFFRPLAGAHLTETRDESLGQTRTEIRCSRCDAHLGHMFDDGPPPTGLRYCINSVAIDFQGQG